MNKVPTKAFDELETATAEHNILGERLSLTFRDLLVKLSGEKRFVNIEGFQIEIIMRYLNTELLKSARNDEKIRLKLDEELQKLAVENRSNLEYYSLIRCLRFLFVTQSDWENVAQDSPIYYFLCHLSKILRDVEPDFVDFFRADLFGEEN
jgi:hypothetical protein